MRRVWSISTVVAMVVSLFSPMMAGAETMHPASCHRVAAPAASHSEVVTHPQKHHCHEMAESLPEPQSGGSVVAATGGQECPMNCCVEGTPQNGTALAVVFQLPSILVSGNSFQFVPVAFTTAGFSSHTDRGPPLTTLLA
jgi:hypothetical protein